MKVLITLSPAEVTGIKQYLKDVCDVDKPNRNDIQRFVNNIVDCEIHAPQCAVSDYINKMK